MYIIPFFRLVEVWVKFLSIWDWLFNCIFKKLGGKTWSTQCIAFDTCRQYYIDILKLLFLHKTSFLSSLKTKKGKFSKRNETWHQKTCYLLILPSTRKLLSARYCNCVPLALSLPDVAWTFPLLMWCLCTSEYRIGMKGIFCLLPYLIRLGCFIWERH